MSPFVSRKIAGLSAISSALLVLFGTAASFGQQVTLPPSGYTMTWSDEFSGTALNTSKWRVRYPGMRDGAMVTAESVSLNGQGQLLLTTFLRDGLVHTGMIGTQQTFQQKYGYFEARIKFQRSQGHHGAFWLQSPTYGLFIDNPEESGTEIDIVEFFGSGRTDRGMFTTVWWNPYSNPSSIKFQPDLGPFLSTGSRIRRQEMSDKFHVYGLLWTPTEYVFYINGIETGRIEQSVSQVNEYIVLSLLSSSWERGRLPLNALPESMIVDYVRVYSRQP